MRKWIYLLPLIFAVITSGYTKENLIAVNLDWQLSIRGGVEHRFNPRIGVMTDLGIGFPGVVCIDGFFVVYLLPQDSRWQVNICSGLPNVLILLGHKAAMVSLGASVMVRRNITEKVGLHFRLGAGYPLFFENDKEVIRDIQLPLNLWPDLTLGLAFKI